VHGSARLQTFLEGLLGLSGTQWRAILSLLVCANLIVYGALGGLLYRYVLSPPSVPASEMEPMPTPTLRPTYTPTWTATPTIAATATGTALPTFTATHVPTFTPTMEPTTTFTATLSSQ
jgi:hypothetical protein